MRKINFDHLACSPLLPEVKEAMLPFLGEEIGNPLSQHVFGEKPARAVEEARENVAGLIHAEPEEVLFTSGGSESNNLAIKGIAQAYGAKGKHIIASPIEHHSVLHPLKSLEKQGYEVSWLPVDGQGLVDPREIRDLIRKDTILITVTSASNEIGTLEPIREIGSVARERGVFLHTDAVAAAGSIPMDVRELNVSLLSLAGNPLYGPQGTGALYVRQRTRLAPLIEGGIQENGLRAGTHNVAGITGLGAAAKLAAAKLTERRKHLLGLRDRLIDGLLNRVSDCFLTGHPVERLPGHASFCVKFIEGEAMLIHLGFSGIAATSGSTCSSAALKVSHVLKAIGIDALWAQGSMVISLGIDNSPEDVDAFLAEFPPIVEKLRRLSPLPAKFGDAGRLSPNAEPSPGEMKKNLF
jgi:cysteine desulfurase